MFTKSLRLIVVFTIAASVLLIGIFYIFAQNQSHPAKKHIENIASKMYLFDTGDLIYARYRRYHDNQYDFVIIKNRTEDANLLKELIAKDYPEVILLKLLKHKNAKVRTLALAALFDKENPKLLPDFVSLMNDSAETFGYARPISCAANRKCEFPIEKQTVGHVASIMVGFYMTRSGFYYGAEHKTKPGFVDYWNARKNRSHCAGWFAVQLARASQGTSPTPKDCVERIRAVRKRIDELPADERTWTLLWLYGEEGSDALVTEEELVEACKKVGPDKLLLMLQNKIPSDDPDLQPRVKSNNWPYKRMSLFILRYADQLLRHDDSDMLLACERWQRDYLKYGISDPNITPWWSVAAARLNPNNASQILHAAMDRFQGEHESEERSTLCVAMWQLAGRSEIGFIVDWFYEDIPERGSFPNSRGSFIEAMGKDPNGKEIISRLIQDPRLADIDWPSLELLVRVVNAWSKVPIVTEEELQKAWHPLGQWHYDWSQANAEQKYPKETAELLAHLCEWRKRLCMSIPTLRGTDMDKKTEIVDQFTPTETDKPR